MPVAAPDALELFHPRVREWFLGRLGEPTSTQAEAWPEIASGRHVLVTAPTGSGKTLTAFLWALDRLLTGAWEGGRTRVLYVSPLKALNNDVRRNLLAPLAELEAAFAASDEAAQPVRVATRSGDTPPRERQKMLRHPPEILITTPESLNILLTSKGGRSILGHLETVVLDEIHAVAGGKRGTHLVTAVERLVGLSGEFQRVALSATVRPLERVARFVGGHRLERTGGEVRYRRREVRVVRSAEAKRYDLVVTTPGRDPLPAGRGSAPPPDPADDLLTLEWAPESHWDRLAGEFKRRIRRNRSTLLFANSRRTVEKITRLLNDAEPSELAYSHHGSLSRELRAVVERRLKQGRLAAIAATNSLELGIDIGALDEVILVQTPPAIASAVQRVGRAGHRVGAVSRGRLYPLYGRDFLDAAVAARGILEQDVEEVRPVRGALDVLAQVLVSMTATESWAIDELYDAVRAAEPYRHLSRRQFDLVLEMLGGRYAASRIRELEPIVSIDRLAGTVRGRRGAARRVYLSGGTIPDRGYFHLRLADSMAKIGELDEEFVWERSLGDTFTLGAQSWRIVRITHNDVLVNPARRTAAMAPFWRAEARNRSWHFSERIAVFLERAEGYLAAGRGDDLRRVLAEEHALDGEAASSLIELLERQRAATGVLPHRRLLVVERFTDPGDRPVDGERRERAVLHTGWGGRVNRPFALALAAAWEERHGAPLEVDANNDAVIVTVARGTAADELIDLVRPDRLEELLRRRLEATGFFGARFRESAGRSLLLPRSGFRRRVPLWLNRERAKKLLAAVASHEDFPVVVETWRTCLQDEFELDTLKRLLDELAGGEIGLREAATTAPSPFCGGLVWQQTNRLMYEDDTPERPGGGLSRGLLQELVFSSSLRPRLPAELVERFQRKLHRTWPGYAPRDGRDLVDWVAERGLVPGDEWSELLEAVERDAAAAAAEPPLPGLLEEAAARLARIELPPPPDQEALGASSAVVAVEALPRLLAALGRSAGEVGIGSVLPDRPAPALAADHRPPAGEAAPEAAAAEDDPLAELAAEWLRFYGPVSRRRLVSAFALDEEQARDLIETLSDGETVVIDVFRRGAAQDELELCDAENLERLLRLLRAERRPGLAARPAEELPLFLAAHQGLVAAPGDAAGSLERSLERLLGYPAPAGLWETDLLPARLDPYHPSWLDGLLVESDLSWVGCGRERLTFAFAGDLELLRPDAGEGDAVAASAGEGAAGLFPHPHGRYSLDELARHSGLGTAELTRRLWRAAWAGEVSNTSFAALRQGLLAKFAPIEPRAASRRRRFADWKGSRPLAGDWYLTARADDGGEPPDALDREEVNKERARLLVERYGVVFRQLAARELPVLGWGALFRSLRLMELAGEIFAGHYFDGVPGLQFASPTALRRLREGLPQDAVYWMNALDPASPSGLGLETFRGEVPPRLPSSHLVFHGPRLVVVSRRNGSQLEIRVGPDHPRLGDYTAFLQVLLTRRFDPLRRIDLERINGEPAASSAYAPAIAGAFSATRERDSLRLRRRY